MGMKKILAMVLALGAAVAAQAGTWNGLTEENWISGPKLTEADLAGKVVLVDEWGVGCPICIAMLPNIQSLWSSFSSKPFVIIGSHRQGRAADKLSECIKKHKLTYPIYQWAGLNGEPGNGGGLPFLYVVNHRGKIVYTGRSHPEATEAIVNALGELGGNYSLTGTVRLDKYKALEKQLVFGKAIKSHVRTLQGDVKKAAARSATAIAKQKGEEAEKILKAIDEACENVKADIEIAKKSNPPEALKLIKNFQKTFPDDEICKTYKEELPEIQAAAKEFAAAQKAAKAKK